MAGVFREDRIPKDLEAHVFHCWQNGCTPRNTVDSVKRMCGLTVNIKWVRLRYVVLSERFYDTTARRVLKAAWRG